MATWNSRGLRGSALEEMLNHTNEKLKESKLALVNKIPTPITPIRIDKETRHITLAYFDAKSTVDYIGVVQGYPICFDAKECAKDTFALQNIHEHQMNYMESFEQQGGIAFFIVWFSQRDEYYYLRYKEAKKFMERMKQGGKKHFKYEELDLEYFIPIRKQMYIMYLEVLEKDLLQRKNSG